MNREDPKLSPADYCRRNRRPGGGPAVTDCSELSGGAGEGFKSGGNRTFCHSTVHNSVVALVGLAVPASVLLFPATFLSSRFPALRPVINVPVSLVSEQVRQANRQSCGRTPSLPANLPERDSQPPSELVRRGGKRKRNPPAAFRASEIRRCTSLFVRP